jgi:HD domain-containing protein
MNEIAAWAGDVAREQLARPLPRRWAHVQGVSRRAQLAAPVFEAKDRDLLGSAALLHDVGYAPNLAHTGFHPLDGARYLRKVNAPERLCALVAHHSCAYQEAELGGLSAELAEWTDEETPLRDALWWADMTTSPDGETVPFERRIAEIQERYGPHDLVTFFIRQAKPELQTAVERTEERLRAAGIAYE